MTTEPSLPLTEVRLGLAPIAGDYNQPVFVDHIPGDDRLFVVDQPGLIWVVDDGEVDVFLDIQRLVGFGGERGLLGMAFHPADPGLFYVNYTDTAGDTQMVEYSVSGDPNRADPQSGGEVLSVSQPAGNHNGGMIAFGPDGHLWIGMGDGGGGNDTYGTGQRGDVQLGSMLRIAVGPENDPYGIPGRNAFEAPEVWSIGMRNPWRFSFDGDSLWIADVGQGAVEEINRVSASGSGLNFGWPIYEGSRCTGDGSRCTGDGFVFPVHEYSHGEGCSVTGGYVYRGEAIPALDGHYFFSDYCQGFIRSIAPDGSIVDWTDQTGDVRVLGFGVDHEGEMYVATLGGTVYKLVAA